MSNLNEWDEDKKGVSIEGLTAIVREMRQAKDAYERAKELSNKLHACCKELEVKIINALESSGMQKFNVPGLGTASLRRTFKVTVPKYMDDKRKLFEYIAEAYGEDVLDEYRSINYQTLNAFYNQEVEAAKAMGEDVNIPGLDEPIEDVGLSFRKDKA